jgi:PIN like domain
MPGRKRAEVRFYFDADVLGLAKLLCQERADFTYPGDPGGRIKKRDRPACIIAAPSAKDPDWIPRVAAQGWLIITRDRHIQEKLVEINAVRDHAAKMLNFSSDDAASTWGQLEVFMARWREIELVADTPGPFIQVVSRTGKFRSIDLDR